MKIEILYPEIANLFGDLANIKYIASSIPDCEIIRTGLKDEPAFLTRDDIDLVYMGTMTENSQVVALDHMEKYAEKIKEKIEAGQHFFFTGNALELLCSDIVDMDDMPYDKALLTGIANHDGEQHFKSERIDREKKTTRCLGLFDINVKRQIMHRANTLYLGKYCTPGNSESTNEIDIVGFKSVFTYAEPQSEIPPLFETVRGPGLDYKLTGEGIHYKNFMATYLTGPIMILNPDFMVALLTELGEAEINPPYREALMDAYKQRLEEFRDEKLNYEL